MIRIPFAEDCYSTLYLRDNKIRTESYYFDWLVIPPITVYNMFNSDFKEYFVKENLKFYSKNTNAFKHTDITVKDVVNDVYYLHHFNNIDRDYGSLKFKFDQRIERMISHLRKNKKIEFYYSACKYDFIKESRLKWGVTEMKRVFPMLKNHLLTKYNYVDSNDITIKYLNI